VEYQPDELATKEDLERVEQRLTNKLDANSEKIDNLTARVDANSEKIDRNSEKIDNLTARVIENSEQIKKMLPKEEFRKAYNELINGQDKMMSVLTRIDQEQAATTARIDWIESDVEGIKARQKG
jgi:uncharacterized protein YjgD (DUF1641 family)